MIFKFDDNIKDKYLLIIKASFGKNIWYIPEEEIKINDSNIKVSINKKKMFGSLKLTYEIDSNMVNKKALVGEKFTLNNFTKYKTIYNNKEYKYLNELIKFAKNDIIEIKFTLLSPDINVSSIFENCNSLKYINGKLILNYNHIHSLSKMFSGCNILRTLSNLSIYNFNDLNKKFYDYESLDSNFDISNLDTSCISDISYLFSKCYFLKTLPDMSKWNIENVNDISHIFEECLLLKSIPDISKWNISNVKNMSHLFYSCLTLEYLPDISKWNTENVTDMSYLFYSYDFTIRENCDFIIRQKGYDQSGVCPFRNNINYHSFSIQSELLELPDISKWNMKNVKYKSYVLSLYKIKIFA